MGGRRGREVDWEEGREKAENDDAKEERGCESGWVGGWRRGGGGAWVGRVFLA